LEGLVQASAFTFPEEQVLTIDYETTGLVAGEDRIHGLGWRYRGRRGYDPVDALPGDVLAALADPNILKVAHNARFEARFSLAVGLPLAGPLFCTMLAQHCLNENVDGLGLDDCVARHIGPGRLPQYAKLNERLRAGGLAHVGQLCALDLDGASGPGDYQLIRDYCLEDVENTFELYKVLTKKLALLDKALRDQGYLKTPQDYLAEETFPTELTMAKCELDGVRIDRDEVRRCQDLELAARAVVEAEVEALVPGPIASIESKLVAKAIDGLKKPEAIAKRVPGSTKYKTEFKLGNPHHLKRLLYDELGMPVQYNMKTKEPTTDDAALQSLKALRPDDAPLLKGIERFREHDKRLTTYIGGPDKGLLSGVRPVAEPAPHDRYYPSYDARIVTGRLGSFAHTFPRDFAITKALRPDPDELFLYFDYSQIELRIAAHLSGEPVMIEAYQEGADLHARLAAKIFRISEAAAKKDDRKRQAAKRTNFLRIYRGGAWRLRESLSEDGVNFSLEECEVFCQEFDSGYPVLTKYLLDQKKEFDQRCFVVSEAGRLRRLPELAIGRHLNWRAKRYQGPRELVQGLEGLKDEELFKAARGRYNHATKQAYNFPIQSLGASITKRAINAAVAGGWRLAYTKHDSAVFRVTRGELNRWRDLKAIAESTYRLRVPLTCDFKILNSLYEEDRNAALEREFGLAA
jgi:DNA polymerase I-like protein with 3'-5' exonuclease and polymerase domains